MDMAKCFSVLFLKRYAVQNIGIWSAQAPCSIFDDVEKVRLNMKRILLRRAEESVVSDTTIQVIGCFGACV